MKVGIISTFIAVVSAATKFNSLTYIAKDNKGECSTLDQVKSDLKSLAKYTDTLYIMSAVDCDTAEKVLSAMEYNPYWKLNMGLWVDQYGSLDREIEKVKKLNERYNLKKHLKSVIAGLNVVSDNVMDVKKMSENISKVKSTLKDLGLSDKMVSSAEKSEKIDSELSKELDFITISDFPFHFDESAQNASNFIFEKIDKVKKIAEGKEVFITGIGWPTEGNSLGQSVPGKDNTLEFMKTFICRANKEYVGYSWFNAIDTPWRIEETKSKFEGYWGILKEDRKTPKFDGYTWIVCENDSTNDIYEDIVGEKKIEDVEENQVEENENNEEGEEGEEEEEEIEDMMEKQEAKDGKKDTTKGEMNNGEKEKKESEPSVSTPLVETSSAPSIISTTSTSSEPTLSN
ncbi:putative family 17 glucosidase SCW10 [Smittium culicis]|uniref:glucan endo-1,3-beta-D-glucosidase n=1 Tax=Smittium culicis TaxID=133412 RepID=A0A1R1XI71_9FUNG|nr:putative family 17 glucosidase SCW10 [Smittium culicis]